MAPIEKKWNENAERDMLMAMLCVNSSGGSIKTNWTAVASAMKQMGYDFTESAINQKFTKSMMKDFRNRHGPDCVARFAAANVTSGSGQASTPRKDTGSNAGGSASASKRKRTAGFTPINTPSKSRKGAPAVGEDDDDLGIKDEMNPDTPTKKLKVEGDGNLDSPLEYPNDRPVPYKQWMEECEP